MCLSDPNTSSSQVLLLLPPLPLLLPLLPLPSSPVLIERFDALSALSHCLFLSHLDKSAFLHPK
jgi:hypothetical protein